MSSSTGAKPATDAGRSFWVPVACAVAVRLLCIWLWPANLYSIDLRNWQLVTSALLVGINPYHGGSLLNWPPMWMETLYAVGRFSDRFDWPFMTCMRVLLTAADAVLIFSTWSLLRRLHPRRKIFAAVLWGLCLNPLLILLTVQQGNFDVIPTILIVWFLIALIRFRRSGNFVDWLIAATWLGLATFAKTFPLALLPLLIAESRRLDLKIRFLGAALCAGPAILSLAPLLVLSPHDVIESVFLYRGTPGTAGISGLLYLLGGPHALIAYAPIFTGFLLLALSATTIVLWRHPPRRDADLVFIAALILMGIFIFGSGFSVQYWYWVAPLLVAAYLQYSRGFSRLVLASAIVIVATELAAFAFIDILGCALFKLDPSDLNRQLNVWFNAGSNMILFSLPMTIVMVLLWIFGLRSVIAPAENPPRHE